MLKQFDRTVAVAALASAAAFAPIASGAQETRFLTIGTGGPTGVYFVVGNSVCRMVHKEAAEGRSEGRQHGLRCSALQLLARPTTSDRSAPASWISASPNRTGSSMPSMDPSRTG